MLQCAMSPLRPAAMLVLLAALGALAVPCCCGVRRQIRDSPDGALLMGPENDVRPNRPKVFTSPEELRGYLEALSNYYAIAGRPRFGKRMSSSPMAGQWQLDNRAIPRHAVPSDIYDMLESQQLMLPQED